MSSDESLSQLNLGYITRIAGNAGRKEARGQGAELRTDGDGVFRPATGMLLTTEARPNAQSHAKAMGETIAPLTQARGPHEGLAGLAHPLGAQQANTPHHAPPTALTTPHP